MAQVPPVPMRKTRNRVHASNNAHRMSQCASKTGKPSQESYRDAIKSAFKCPVCLDSMVNPAIDSRVLPCQHALCRTCLTNIFDTCLADDSSGMGPLCPECRAPIGVSRVDQLPPNVQLNRLLSSLEEWQQKQQSSLDSSASRSSCSASSNKALHSQKQGYGCAASTAAAPTLSGNYCTAIHEFSYGPADSRYLELRPGDLIEIISRRCSNANQSAAHTGWAYGRIGLRKGYFPLAYTRPVAQQLRKTTRSRRKSLVLEDQCQQAVHPVVSALHSWEPTSFDGVNLVDSVALLPLVKDRKYLVLTKQPNGWLHGQCQVTMATGLFPASYVAKVQPVEPTLRSWRTRTTGIHQILTPVSSSSRNASLVVNDLEASTSSTAAAAAAVAPASSTSTGNVSLIQSLRNFFSRKASRPSQSRQRQLTNQSSTGIEIIVGTPTTILSEQLQQSQRMPASQRQSWQSENVAVYKCIKSRRAATDAELNLTKGELVCVISHRLDGWYRGFSIGTQQSGLFPAACVKFYSSAD